jgi:hypothetical protein
VAAASVAGTAANAATTAAGAAACRLLASHATIRRSNPCNVVPTGNLTRRRLPAIATFAP